MKEGSNDISEPTSDLSRFLVSVRKLKVFRGPMPGCLMAFPFGERNRSRSKCSALFRPLWMGLETAWGRGRVSERERRLRKSDWVRERERECVCVCVCVFGGIRIGMSVWENGWKCWCEFWGKWKRKRLRWCLVERCLNVPMCVYAGPGESP